MPQRSVASILTLLGVLLLSGCVRTALGLLNAGQARPQSVVFDATHRLSLDIYRPQSATGDKPPPIVVFFYGGSWKMGERGQYRFVGDKLAQNGMLAVLPDYRTYPQVKFPAFMEDAANAVAWICQHASEIGGDPSRIFIAGHSAGAHIAGLLGTDGRYLQAVGITPKDLAGVIGVAGPYDFLPFTDDWMVDIFGSDAESQTRSQPINFVDGDEPPFLLIYGGDDKVVWPRNSENLAVKLRQHGESVRLVKIPGIGHFRILGGFRFSGVAPELVPEIRRFVFETQSPAK
ncbi:MAG: alpha/beta hydrolase [Dokdonella sp.]